MYNNKYIVLIPLFMDFGPSKSWGSSTVGPFLCDFFSLLFGERGNCWRFFANYVFLCSVVLFLFGPSKDDGHSEMKLHFHGKYLVGVYLLIWKIVNSTLIIWCTSMYYVEFFHYSLTIFNFIFHMYVLKKILFFFF